ncbi:MAG: hypothetical protein E5X33_00090 [Mesorhizobium sp.]|nr:MAG: hypothetical protein EOR22_30225 [Mesorhizobium sp.]TIR24315.1 MAG: hypothetical protein E5X33_00090 [Mesorhizobium sp.]
MHELENAADQIADASRADLQVLLRRAALLLRNVGVFCLRKRSVIPLAATKKIRGRSRAPINDRRNEFPC